MMNVASRKRRIAALVSVCVAACLMVAAERTVLGQQGEDAKPSVQKKERAKPRGRLPNYYAAVVSQAQREKIYGIQAKYTDRIEELQKQLDALKNQRDDEVEAVLTPDQLAKVVEAREAATAKRKKKREAKAE